MLPGSMERTSGATRHARRRAARPRAGLLLTAALGTCVLTHCGRTGVAPAARADRILVVKRSHTMTLLSHGRALKSYTVALGRGGGGAKTRKGDRETPEGDYVIDAKNPHSRFHRALHVSYPNARDRERARKLGVSPGGDVEIHGIEERWAWLGGLHRQVDWTAGCIAVTNPEIDEIYRLVAVGTPVEIRAE